jgi:hypothetical protein
LYDESIDNNATQSKKTSKTSKAIEAGKAKEANGGFAQEGWVHCSHAARYRNFQGGSLYF